MIGIATRADGQPAHVRAKPRLRQSHFDALRRFPARIAEMRAEEARLADEAGEAPEINPLFGAIIASGLLCILSLMTVVFVVMTDAPL